VERRKKEVNSWCSLGVNELLLDETMKRNERTNEIRECRRAEKDDRRWYKQYVGFYVDFIAIQMFEVCRVRRREMTFRSDLKKGRKLKLLCLPRRNQVSLPIYCPLFTGQSTLELYYFIHNIYSLRLRLTTHRLNDQLNQTN
jgi:hypothetical protein